MFTIFKRALIVAFIGTVTLVACTLAAKRSTPSPRAAAPTWENGRRDRTFFKNAFQEALVGLRPSRLGSNNSASPSGANSELIQVPQEPSVQDRYPWSGTISRQTIEDEIKRTKSELDKIVTTPAKYKGGGFKDGRFHFTVLAMMFGIVTEYDSDVRWLKSSQIARNRFSRAGKNAKVGSIDAYNEAKQRKDDIDQLLNGEHLEGKVTNDSQLWNDICDRPPLMQRLEKSENLGISRWTASKSEFSKNKDNLKHEAEIVAAICEIISQKEFEFTDDDDYLAYCQRLKKAAQAIIEAVKVDQYNSARKAAGQLNQTCTECHENYRA